MSCGPQCRTGPEFDPEFEGPSDADIERFGAEFVSCPNCTTDVYDQAEVCPTCNFTLGDTAALSDKKRLSPALIGAVALVVVAAFVLILVR